MSYFKYIIFILALLKHAQPSKDEERLIADLFGNYTPAARPALKDNDTVKVKFGLTLSQIIDVQEKNQILVISAWTRQIWYNPLLTWDPLKYHGIEAINIDPKTIWKPDIVLYNNADDDKSFGGNLDRLNTRAILEYTGKTKWLAPIILKSKCDIDVKHFPFDSQECPLKFGSWTYDKSRLNLVNESDVADTGMYSNNSEWFLEKAECKRSEKEYVCCPGQKFPDVTFKIKIARRSLFYLLNLIFPMTIIGMLTMCSFLLPAESGERISLAITLLLAMTVFMLVVADIIPATSDVVPLVGIFFNASMVEMVIMIVVLCYIMRLYHKDADDPPMSLWTRRFFLDWLSYKVGTRMREKKSEDDDNICQRENSYVIQNQNKATDATSKRHSISSQMVTKEDDVRKCYPECDGHLMNRISNDDLLYIKLDVLIARVQNQDAEDNIKQEWTLVARTIDRCLFVAYILLYLINVFGVFSVAPGYIS